MNPIEQVPIESVCLIGTGRMGRCHLLAAQALRLRIAAVCDKREDSLASVSSEFKIPSERRFSNPSDLFGSCHLADLVIIATTADSHSELVIQAAQAGARRILCEKPMATSLQDCDEMLSACRKAGTHLAINHQMRFMSQYTRVKEELGSGKLGPLASMNVVGGCFGIAMNGSHYCEAFAYLTGSQMREVTAWFAPQPVASNRGLQFSDEAGQLRVVAASGERLNMEFGPDQGHGMVVTYAARYGHIIVDELQAVSYVTARKPEHLSQPVTRYAMPWTRHEMLLAPANNVDPTKAVLEALIDGRNYPSGQDGHAVVRAMVAAYKSSSLGNRPVDTEQLDDWYERRFPWA